MLAESEKSDTEEEIEDFSDRPRTAFTEEQLKSLWEEYIKKLKSEKRSSLASTLASCEPQIGEGFALNLMFGNIVQEQEFLNEQTNLLGFLRPKLNNWGIHIKTEVKVDEKKKRYYTNSERFERLVELNPKLDVLRTRLGLNPDF